MRRWQIPAPPAVFLGRERETARLADALARVPVALVYGVAGVGKSALVHAFAERWGEAAVYARATEDAPLGALVDDARRQLARGPVPEVTSDDERIADLVERLESEPALFVVEDLHGASEPESAHLVRTLSRSLRRGRFIGTSRHKLARKSSDPDRFEITMDDLDEQSSRELWSALDDLYGPSSGYEAARARAGGNPFRLRRAHAGGLDDEDPIATAIEALDDGALEVANVLALSGGALERAALEHIIGKDRARAALKVLVARLIVDVDGSGRTSLHGLFSEALSARLSEADKRALHARLAEAVPRLGLDRIAEAAQTSRHLRLAGELAAAARVLVERTQELVSAGATGELVRGLEAIPQEARTQKTELSLARGYARLLNLEKAYASLSALEQREPDPTGEVQLALATVALSSGRIERGRDVIDRALELPGLGSAIRTELEMQQAWARYHAGACDETRRDVMARATNETRALAGFFSVITLMQHGRGGRELAEAIELARGLLPDRAPPYTAKVTVPLALAAALARLGRIEESDELAGPAEASAKQHEDLQTQVYVTRMFADMLLAKGDRLAALEAVRKTKDAYRKAGSKLGWLLGSASTARALYELGRRREADRLADEAEEGAREAGIGSVLHAVAAARQSDPVALLGEEKEPSYTGHRSDDARAAALAALTAGSQGEAAVAERHLAELTRLSGTDGYGVERSIALLTRATLARIEGKIDAADKLLSEARAASAEGGVDSEVFDGLASRVGGGRAVTLGAKRALSAAPPPMAFDVILDGRTHELRAGKKVVTLAKRPTLRKLLYAMAGRPNRALTKAELAAAIWPGRYDPLRHDGALWVNLRRLRQLLASTPLAVELWNDGYRLVVPESFIYLDPGRAD